MGRLARLLLIGLAMTGSGIASAWADDCTLKRLPVDLVPNSMGAILMSLKVGDKPATFMLNTSSFWSAIYRDQIGDLRTRHRQVKLQGMGDRTNDEVVVLPSLSIGAWTAKHREMFVFDRPQGSRGPIDGFIGSDIFTAFDMEIDLSENKLNLFLPSNCGDRVVYWQNEGFTELEFNDNASNHIVFEMKLDGKPLRTILSTGSDVSYLKLSSAAWLFDLRPGEPGMDDFGSSTDLFGNKMILYRHQFQTLEINSLKYNKPWIIMTKGNFGQRANASPFDLVNDWPSNTYDFILGRHQLRGLHIYIAYQDRKIYVTKSTGPSTDSPTDGEATLVTGPMPDKLDEALLQPFCDRANAARRARNFDAARAAYDDLVAQYPNYPQAYFYRARINVLRNDAAAALVDLDHAIALLPTYAEAYRLRAGLRRNTHDDDGAKADLDAAMKFEPNSAMTYEMRAEQRRHDEDDDGALADANRAIELDPKLAVAYVTRGEVFYHRKDYEQALAEVQQASALDPKNTLAFEVAGHAFHRLGRQDEALASYGQAVELAPKLGRYRNSRCWQLAMMERFQDALDDCTRGVELAPKWYPMVDSRGYVYLKLHRLKEAIADFDTALAIKPDAAHSMYGRSLAKQELGDAKGAKADLTAAQRLQPDIAEHFPE